MDRASVARSSFQFGKKLFSNYPGYHFWLSFSVAADHPAIAVECQRFVPGHCCPGAVDDAGSNAVACL